MAKKKLPKYRVDIYWSAEDICYLANVPELKGCITHGSSYANAAKNAQEAIEAYIESLIDDGKEAPVPFAEKDFSGKLNVRMSPELHRALALEAQLQNKSINAVILESLEECVKAS